jgi:heme exporter protein C
MWLIYVSYLLLRRFGGPGSERLAAAVGLFGMFNVPFVYWSVNLWRTLHPKTTVVPTLPVSMGLPLWVSTVAFLGLFALLLTLRRRLEDRRTDLEALHLALEE